MNLHVMIILLSLHMPATQTLEPIEAPQIVAPLSIHEDEASLAKLKAERLERERILRILMSQV